MANKDYYQILGVQKSAAKEEIKKAFKRLAMQYHPDRASEDKKKEHEEKFKEINEAVSILGDDKKRQQYDQFGSAAFSGGAGGSAGAGFQQGFDYSDIMSQFRSGMFGDFDDIFDHLFGGSGGGGRQRARRGADLLYETEITLEEAYSGAPKTVSLNKLERCQECQGKGAHQFESCHHCHGSGYMKRTQRTPFGLFQQTGPCPYCHGKGELPQDSCDNCGGEAVVRRKKELEVSIPAGIEDGMRLRVPGEGEIGEQNGPAGDLYVQIRIEDHELFQRKGKDLHLAVPISFSQAVLGDEIDVPTIDGKATLTIAPGTQTETILRMRGKGMPSLHDSGKGDQMVTVQVLVPTKLSRKQKELIKELHEEKPQPGFFKKIFTSTFL